MAKPKDKERILKAAREMYVGIYKRAPIRRLSDISTEILGPEGTGMKYSR